MEQAQLRIDDFKSIRTNLKSVHEQSVLESWRLMISFTDTLRMHHLLSAESELDQEISQTHSEIANLLELTRNKYQQLIDKKSSAG